MALVSGRENGKVRRPQSSTAATVRSQATRLPLQVLSSCDLTF